MEQWYPRSAGHADAHRGERDSRTGTLTARWGLVFTPEPALFGPGPATLSSPVELGRCCPACQNASARIGGDGRDCWDDDADGAAAHWARHYVTVRLFDAAVLVAVVCVVRHATTHRLPRVVSRICGAELGAEVADESWVCVRSPHPDSEDHQALDGSTWRA